MIRTRADLLEWADRAREAEALYVIVRSGRREVARVQLPRGPAEVIAEALAARVRDIEGDSWTIETVSRRTARYIVSGEWPITREALR